MHLQLYTVFNNLAKAYELKGAIAGYNACPPIVNVNVMHFPNNRCETFNAEAHKFIKRHNIKTIFLVSNWAVYLHGYFPNKDRGGSYLIREDFDPKGKDRFKIFSKAVSETLDSFSGRIVYVLGSAPSHAHRVPEVLALEKQQGYSQEELWTTRTQYLDWQQSVIDVWLAQVVSGHVTFIDPTELFCGSGRCIVQSGGFALYTDDNHLSWHGALLLRPLLEPAFALMQKNL